MAKPKVREVIVVEGRYDKNTLSQVVDAVIVELGGFAVFNDKEKQAFLRKLAKERGIILFTDPDGAGFVIRNRVKGNIPEGRVLQAYVPDIYGKEKRKRKGGKEGKLGVEGMKPEILLDALRRAGATIDEEFFIDHGTGVVIGETAVIGKGCRLYQGVTLGALSFPKDGDGVLVKGVPRHPILEDNVTVYAGATILGRITIGSGSIIGGNVWVTKDVPAGTKLVQKLSAQPTEESLMGKA